MDVKKIAQEARRLAAFYEQFNGMALLADRVADMLDEEERLERTLAETAIECIERRRQMETEYEALHHDLQQELDQTTRDYDSRMEGMAAQLKTVHDHLKDLRAKLHAEARERDRCVAVYKAEIGTLVAERDKLREVISRLNERVTRS